MPRQEIFEDLRWRRLVHVLRFGSCVLALETRNRQQPLDNDPLRDHRFEFVVDEIHAGGPAGCEFLDRRIGQRRGVSERQPLEDASRFVANVETASTKEVAAFSADQAERDLVLLAFFDDELPCGFDDVRVETATQTAVRGDDDQQRS